MKREEIISKEWRETRKTTSVGDEFVKIIQRVVSATPSNEFVVIHCVDDFSKDETSSSSLGQCAFTAIFPASAVKNDPSLGDDYFSFKVISKRVEKGKFLFGTDADVDQLNTAYLRNGYIYVVVKGGEDVLSIAEPALDKLIEDRHDQTRPSANAEDVDAWILVRKSHKMKPGEVVTQTEYASADQQQYLSNVYRVLESRTSIKRPFHVYDVSHLGDVRTAYETHSDAIDVASAEYDNMSRVSEYDVVGLQARGPKHRYDSSIPGSLYSLMIDFSYKTNIQPNELQSIFSLRGRSAIKEFTNKFSVTQDEAVKLNSKVQRFVDDFWSGKAHSESKKPVFAILSPAGWYVMRDTRQEI